MNLDIKNTFVFAQLAKMEFQPCHYVVTLFSKLCYDISTQYLFSTPPTCAVLYGWVNYFVVYLLLDYLKLEFQL